MDTKAVTRFAPSPTGFLHIGGVRTALFAYLWARKHKGTFILRIEDTDKVREVPGSIEHIQESLKWLNIDWDYGPDKPGPFGPTIQSQRLQSYRDAAQLLIDEGLAYADPYTPEEVEAFRAEAQAEKRPFLFRDHRPKTEVPWDGTKPLRFKVPAVKRYTWTDAVRGKLEAGEEALDDFVLIKTDGYPTYNFAHIVDDYHMGVTHIMRADEFISSTPRFLSLYDALGYPVPTFVTLPPILRDDKTKKLGKRDGAKDILDYRTDGYLQDAMVNFLAFIGWNPGTEQELFTREELIQAFDIAGIQAHGAVLNEDKLNWFNKEYLTKLSDDAFVDYILPVAPEGLSARKDVLIKLAPTLRERVHVRSELKAEFESGSYDWTFLEPDIDSAKLVWKESTPSDTATHLTKVIEILSNPDTQWISASSIKDAVWPYADSEGRGAVLWPTRFALTGKDKSPDPFTVAYALGKETTLQRLQKALALLA